MSETLRFTDENFKREVLDGELPVFVDFWGSWCPPCKMVEPVIEELAAEFAGKVKIGKLNVDRNPAVRSEFQITAAPTFILFRNGKILKRAIGSHSKKQLLEIIEIALAPRYQRPEIEITELSEPVQHRPAELFRRLQ